MISYIGKKIKIKKHPILSELSKKYPFLTFKLHQRTHTRINEDKRTIITVHTMKFANNGYEYICKLQNKLKLMIPLLSYERVFSGTDINGVYRHVIELIEREDIKTIHEYEQENLHADS